MTAVHARVHQRIFVLNMLSEGLQDGRVALFLRPGCITAKISSLIMKLFFTSYYYGFANNNERGLVIIII